MRGDFEREKYLTERLKLQPREWWDEIDAWPLYVGKKNLERNLYLASAFQETRDVPGDIAEFGVWRGATTSLMAKLIWMFEPHGRKRVHGFDHWRGFDAKTVEEKGLRNSYQGVREKLEQFLLLNELSEFVELHDGPIEETAAAVIRERQALQLSLVLIDCDVYDPTIAALRAVHDRLSIGGLILFDEWGDEQWAGETQAAREFLAEHGGQYETSTTRIVQPGMQLRRIQ